MTTDARAVVPARKREATDPTPATWALVDVWTDGVWRSEW
jgi:hypothetical protein